MADMQGGTFTISNGGVYGSLMSSPILNAPQSGILGMHKIQDRPVVVGGQIVIRPMMYLALSYDHRIVDGKEAVTFLVRVKESLEDPERLVLDLVRERGSAMDAAALAASPFIALLAAGAWCCSSFHVSLQGVMSTLELGSAWNAGPRDVERKPSGKLAGRSARASANFQETYPAFVGLALALAIAGDLDRLGPDRRLGLDCLPDCLYSALSGGRSLCPLAHLARLACRASRSWSAALVF